MRLVVVIPNYLVGSLGMLVDIVLRSNLFVLSTRLSVGEMLWIFYILFLDVALVMSKTWI